MLNDGINWETEQVTQRNCKAKDVKNRKVRRAALPFFDDKLLRRFARSNNTQNVIHRASGFLDIIATLRDI